MITYAMAELAKDEHLMVAVRKAEKKTGVITGDRFSETGQHLVQVSFYPTRTWWITDMDKSGATVGELRELTREENSTGPGASGSDQRESDNEDGKDLRFPGREGAS